MFVDAYFQIGQSIYPPLSGQQDPNSLYQDAIYLGNDGLQVQMDINPANSAFSDSQWSLIDDNMAKHNYNMQPVPIPHIPWTSEQLPLSGSQSEEGSETATFDLQQIAVQQKIACESNNGNEEYADNHAFKNEFICHETAATPPGESDNDSWIIPFDPKNYTPTHSSPGSSRSVRSQTSSPRQNELDSHGHVFTSFSGISKPKISKGRQRNLTQLEKRQAREVRDAKACWACHISKTKVCATNFHEGRDLTVYSVLRAPLVALVNNVQDWLEKGDFASLTVSMIHLNRCTSSLYQVWPLTHLPPP